MECTDAYRLPFCHRNIIDGCSRTSADFGAWFKNGTLAINGSMPPMLARSVVDRKVAQHLRGESDERAFLWNLYLLGQWSREAGSLAAA